MTRNGRSRPASRSSSTSRSGRPASSCRRAIASASPCAARTTNTTAPTRRCRTRAYPMKGVGPFTHTDPRDRPPEIFGGTNTLHFGADRRRTCCSRHSAEQMNAMSVIRAVARELGGLPLPFGERERPESPLDSARMIRAAIVGLGRWGRSLVNAVQGKSDDIRFVRAHTRTRASAEDFCREKNVPLVDRYERHPRRSEDRRGGAGDAAQPARAADPGGGRCRQAHPRREADHARSAERGRGGRRRAQGRRRAGGRLLPALPSVGGRDPQAPDGRPARAVVSMVAQHTTSTGTVHPAGQLARRARGGAGRRVDRGRRAFARSHDRVRRPGARRPMRDRALHRQARRTTPPP